MARFLAGCDERITVVSSSDGTKTRRGHLVTLGVVLVLAAGLGLTVRGLGAADEALASFDAASWVWSREKGEIARLNGVAAKVDTRVDVGPARGHELEVSQSDRFVLLRDVHTGAIGTMDLADLQAFWNAQSEPGRGISVALHEAAAFIVDAVRGKVQQVDPKTLTSLGEPLSFPPGITGGTFDGKGRLWVASPSEGTATAIAPAAPAADGGAQSAPQRERTESVAEPSHDLALTTLDDGAAVLDRTTNMFTRLGASRSTIELPLSGPGILPPHTDGRTVAVTVPGDRKVYAVDETGVRTEVTVPGDTELPAAVAWEGYLYVADGDRVHVFDRTGKAQEQIGIARPGGSLELEVRENYLFINAPGAQTARVVDNTHTVRVVDKYANDVLGGDPPATENTPPPPPKRKPPKPQVKEPGAPRNVRAAAGNAEARVTWQAAADNGAAISKYVVSGAGRTFQVGAEQRSLVVDGLTNGETYEFAVHAVNRKGDGPAKSSNPVRPTSEVPDAPAAPVAEAKPDGTVTVTWPAANGQGHDITRYTVTAVSEGGAAPIGDATETSLTIADGKLEYGKQYAFTVVAVNDIGAGSQASPVSNSVVPFAKPGRPDSVAAETVQNQAGAVQVTWTAAADNGRPVTKYVVTAAGKATDVTDGTAVVLTGLGNGASVPVEVAAVNEAGTGEAATATARTVAAPTVTVTAVNPTFNTATVTFAVGNGGGETTCTLAVSDGGKGSSGSCSSLGATGLKPSTSYTFTVSAKNAAGTTTKTSTKTTDALYGTATCINGSTGDQRTYCNADVDGRNGNEIFKVTRQVDAQQAGWVKNGTKLKAFCKASGDEVYAFVYNNDKRSTTWIQVDYEGKTYIPWAWFNLDGGDDLGDLPAC
ncbi:fibronectin type III domain-containing protein [Actinoplanes sp. NPDC051861]|uniref:fibronectin type III domain-containing protein n=1 Tax=Actinoplanes sp. NPDC051861 TaxID=3155170 RepID=UPI0034394F5B